MLVKYFVQRYANRAGKANVPPPCHRQQLCASSFAFLASWREIILGRNEREPCGPADRGRGVPPSHHSWSGPIGIRVRGGPRLRVGKARIAPQSPTSHPRCLRSGSHPNGVSDLVVEDAVIVEIKAVESVAPVHKKQLFTYLKLADKRLGLLINFNVALIKRRHHPHRQRTQRMISRKAAKTANTDQPSHNDDQLALDCPARATFSRRGPRKSVDS